MSHMSQSARIPEVYAGQITQWDFPMELVGGLHDSAAPFFLSVFLLFFVSHFWSHSNCVQSVIRAWVEQTEAEDQQCVIFTSTNRAVTAERVHKNSLAQPSKEIGRLSQQKLADINHTTVQTKTCRRETRAYYWHIQATVGVKLYLLLTSAFISDTHLFIHE